MRNIEAVKMNAKDEVKEASNPFDNFSFWLQLAYMDFTSDLKAQTTEAEERL